GGSAILSTGAGTLTLEGTGGNGTSSNQGVLLNNSQVSSVTGAISIKGKGGNGSGDANHGIYAHTGAQITSTGSATITLEGTGGASGSSTGDHGILLNGATTRVIGSTGAISLTGTGAGANAWGVALENGGHVLTSNNADISIEATGAGGNAAFRVIYANAHVGVNSTLHPTATGGNITITTDSNNWDGGLMLKSAGILTIKPRSNGSPVQIGASGSSATSLNLRAADIGNMADGFSEIIIGSTAAGNITVPGAVTFTDPLRILTGGSLTINQALNTGGNRLALLSTGATTQGANGRITAGSLRLGGNGNFTLEHASNSVNTVAKNGTGFVRLRNAGALTVGSVDTISGVTGSTV
ncbi:MAG TPA: hypothetical protein PLA50_05135, partial [Bacteroidia bacterium]|nr:hypothetical protein [Bacteroidia bacterium]